MKRRSFLQKTTAGLGALAGWPRMSEGMGIAPPTVVAPLGQNPPPDNYRAPDWLRYSRSVYFEGYCPPVFPQVKDFDARRIVELAGEIGGDTLRFQPITYRALFPSKLYPTYPELGRSRPDRRGFAGMPPGGHPSLLLLHSGRRLGSSARERSSLFPLHAPSMRMESRW